jgi:signal transduction histidine kinase
MRLFIVKRLAEDTGGKVEVESKLGKAPPFTYI